MSQINPFTGSILQSTQAQRQQATEKDRQVRRAQEQVRNSSLTEDTVEHQVESSEELHPVQDDQRHERRFKRSKQQQHSQTDDGDNDTHLDLKA
jgi:hypothetical protein